MITNQQLADQIVQEFENIGIYLALFDSKVLPDLSTPDQPRYRVLKTRRDVPGWRPLNKATVARFKEDARLRKRLDKTLFNPSTLPGGFSDAAPANVVIWNPPDGVPITPLIRCFHSVYLANGDAPDANPNCTVCQKVMDSRNVIIEPYENQVRRIVNRIVKGRYDKNFEDAVVNDTLLRASKYHGALIGRHPKQVSDYLHKAAKHAYLTEKEHRDRIDKHELVTLPKFDDEGDEIERPIERYSPEGVLPWHKMAVADMLPPMSDDDYAIVMAYYAGESQASIAARTGVDQSTISRLLRRLRN